MEKIATKRLGFGLMRLPLDKDGKIDYATGEKMVDTALQNGINYFDTAFMYHNGESEKFVGKALGQRKPRDSFLLADKMPMTMIKAKEELEDIFTIQLERCCVEYFDYYLLHAMNKDNFQKVKDLDVLAFLRQKQSEGKIKKIGFSFHDTCDVLEDIIAYTQWDFLQLQMNYYDMDKEDFAAQHRAAIASKLPIIVMEPIRGGFLARLVPKALPIIEKSYGVNKAASLALSYAQSLEGVQLVLSGMSDEEQLADNINTFSNLIAIDSAAEGIIADVLEEIARFKAVECTSCEYCMPCPLGINIPEGLKIYNSYQMFKNEFSAKSALAQLAVKPSECTACKKCELRCPQKLPISKTMQEFAQSSKKF